MGIEIWKDGYEYIYANMENPGLMHILRVQEGKYLLGHAFNGVPITVKDKKFLEFELDTLVQFSFGKLIRKVKMDVGANTKIIMGEE